MVKIVLEVTSKKVKFPCGSASQVSINIPFGHMSWSKQHHSQVMVRSWANVGRPERGRAYFKISFWSSYCHLPCVIKLGMYSLKPLSCVCLQDSWKCSPTHF